MCSWAEHWRKRKALAWLGKEMPPWAEPCPIRIKWDGSPKPSNGGSTSFAFEQGRVLYQVMEVEGNPDRVARSVLPHEITHTVLAYHFGEPLPRWADEGAAMASEDKASHAEQEGIFRGIMAGGRAMPLRRLFALQEYPPDTVALYAQGYSVASFLLSSKAPSVYLDFVATGMKQGWDGAAAKFYGYNRVEDLEAAWLLSLRSK